MFASQAAASDRRAQRVRQQSQLRRTAHVSLTCDEREFSAMLLYGRDSHLLILLR